ncbi:Aspartic proteinase nepenthesin-1 [Dichanthelium oligosanthes]|uniref:Aspartic proteinase nepenthesin-1 n=1 Tax=Dichanthelium oligosanthes TaxID=888268 RepID=A0A1E5VGH9_9POAL|nr:Aspartic proteinase nepenthesin-1 [Dichanthelium oligosanthes]
MAAKLFLHALVFFFLVAAPFLAYSEGRVFRATMMRSEKAINFTQAARRSQERLWMLSARLDAAAGGVSTQTPLQKMDGAGEYGIAFSIGTPPQELSALADTGSDLVWVKCGACVRCAPQGSPSYYPNTSSSFSKLPCSSGLCGDLKSKSRATCDAGGSECDYTYFYGLAFRSHHYTMGYLGSETFTLGSDAVPGIGFGCTTMSEGGYGTGSGLVGLGRGPLSLVKQLRVGAFSYCLTSDPSKTSPLLFGSGALTGAGVQSTPLVQGLSPTYYTVDLRSISIGAVTTLGTRTSGIVFDSGTTLTFLAEPAYTLAKAALLSQTNLPLAAGRGDGSDDVCFQTSGGSADVPSMVLHFDGADMALPAENFFLPAGNGGVICWVVRRSPSRLSIVGNIMQMDYHVRYDVDNSVLSFQPANCDNLEETGN